MVSRLESVDLTRNRGGVAGRIEGGNATHIQFTGKDALPVLVGADTAGRDHAETGDHRTRHAATSGFASTMADWNPPKPLPTETTTSTGMSRAVLGT